MKNKKLFAILTLVCFMFTLMPVAAFAAAPTYVAGQVYVQENGEWVTATEAPLTVNATTSVAVAYSAAGATPTAASFVFAENENGVGVAYATDGNLALPIGEYVVYAVTTAMPANWTLDFKALATTAEKVAGVKAWAQSVKALSNRTATVEVVDGDYTFDIKIYDKDGNELSKVPGTNTYDLDIFANNGWTEEGVLSAELNITGGASTIAMGKDLTFTSAGYVSVELEEGNKTNTARKVPFEVVSEKAGTYNVTVSYGKLAVAKIQVTVSTATLANVVVNDVPATTVNVEETVAAADVEFKFTDANGAAYTALDIVAPTSDYKIDLVEKPANSKLKSENFVLTNDSDDVAGVYTLACTKGDAGFDKEGSYTIKVTLANGASAEATVKAAKQGDVVGITFVKPVSTIIYNGEKEVVSAVRTIDAAGVTAAILDPANIEWSVSGKAVVTFQDVKLANGTAGTNNIPELKVNDEDYIGQTVTVYAKYGDFVTSSVVTVTDMAANIVYASTEGEVGVTNKLSARIFDEAGKAVVLAAATESAIILEKPEGAVAVADVVYAPATGVTLNLLGSVAGEYKVQTVLVYNDGGVPRYLTTIDTFTLGAAKGEFKDVVVMSINSAKIVKNSEVKDIPAAAVIKDSRTMVPFRALAEAFGATVDYDQATGNITAELNGVKVVMKADEKAFTVNGVAKAADVAPYLNVEASTTMVPVSFVANAFGINYQCIFAEDGTVADVLFTK